MLALRKGKLEKDSWMQPLAGMKEVGVKLTPKYPLSCRDSKLGLDIVLPKPKLLSAATAGTTVV